MRAATPTSPSAGSKAKSPITTASTRSPPDLRAYAAIERVFGESQTAIHWGSQFYALFTLAFIFLIGRRLFGEEAASRPGPWPRS